MKTILVFIACFVTPLIIFGGSYISYSNNGVDWEKNVSKFDQESQNVLASFTTKVQEIAQLPDMYKDNLKEVIKAEFEGRYGADGSKAVFQMIQEKSQNFDSTLFNDISEVIKAGRTEFKLSQTQKIEVCTNYEAARSYAWSGFWLTLAGYPKDGTLDKCKIVLNDHTNEAFKTKIDNGIQFKK